MVNNGYLEINSYPQQLGRLSHFDLGQAQLTPVQAMDMTGSHHSGVLKATYTSDFSS
jgi:hypothetical protein